ncbi:MFS transporter, partial [Salmonella enterica]|nr:MFS transporter [Salmonella enterica]EBR0795834.1 MFS transporter [Salmonella enterica]
ALPAALLSFFAMSSLLVYGHLKYKQQPVTPVAG